MLWLLLACTDPAPPPAEDAVPPPWTEVTQDGPFFLASSPRVRQQAPQRFTQPLGELVGSWDARVESLLEDEICFDRGDRRAELLAEVDGLVVLDEETRELRAGELEYLLDYCRIDDYCAWLGAEVPKREGLPRHVLASGLGGCNEPELAPLLVDTHVGHVVAFHNRLGRRSTWGPELVWAVDEVVAGRSDDGMDLVSTLAGRDDPRVADALLRIEAAGDEALALEAAFSMLNQSHPQARQRYSIACSAHPGDQRCDADYAEEVQLFYDPLLDLGRWIQFTNSDPVDLAAEHPDYRNAVTRAARDCVDGELVEIETGAGSYAVLEHCLRALTTLDRPVAAQRFEGLDALEQPVFTALASQLRAYPNASDLGRHLVELELLDAPADVGEIGEFLRKEDRGVKVAAAGGAPAYLQTMAASVAALVDDLDGVVFEEIPPAEAIGTGQAATTLLAWGDGDRWQISLGVEDGERDLVRVAAFLNRILVDEESPVRVVVQDSWSTSRFVIVGPEAGLRALHDGGLLAIDQPL